MEKDWEIVIPNIQIIFILDCDCAFISDKYLKQFGNVTLWPILSSLPLH